MDRVSSANLLATFWLDVEYTRIAPAFAAAGIGTILLKGTAFDQLLFDGGRSRGYSDIDLLVDPARVVAAERLLGQLGFTRAEKESVAPRHHIHGHTGFAWAADRQLLSDLGLYDAAIGARLTT